MNNKINQNNHFKVCVKAVREVIRAMPQGERFTGWELKEKCVALYPELTNVYVDTLLREMREYCKEQYQLISRSESLYEKVGLSERQKEFEKYKNMKQQDFNFMEI